MSLGSADSIDSVNMEQLPTLPHILAARAAGTPEKIAFSFHKEPPCTYLSLWRGIKAFALYLRRQGVKEKEPVIIVIPNSAVFFEVFYGVQLAEAIAVPLYPGSGADRILKLANFCGAKWVVVSEAFPPAGLEELKEKLNMELSGKWGKKPDENLNGSPISRELTLLSMETVQAFWKPEEGNSGTGPGGAKTAVGRLDGMQGDEILPINLSPGDTAFIQFTSGSTGEPKGVQLTHANLLLNLRQMIAGMAITERDSFVSWLPVYHDMGLILMTMVPFYLGLELFLLPTGLNYLKRWLEAIEERRATFTAAPDFAYRLVLLYVKPPLHYDLSSLRVALNAAEPVRADTIGRFEERFKIQNVLLPAYGLAEATVGVCAWKPGQKIKVDNRGFVSVGKPFPEITMKICKEDATSLPPGNTGEIKIHSGANTKGYLKNREATEELMDSEGFIHTGDLGYMDEAGDYYIVGRKKNIIIQGGFNIASREVEELVDEFPFVRRSAAIGIDRGRAEGEQVYIFAEVILSPKEMEKETVLEDCIMEMVQGFAANLGFRPGRVYLVKRGTIPMTYNGKIQYPRLKELYLTNNLKQNILFPLY